MIIHVTPLNDLHEHIEAEWCLCQPRVEEDGELIIHNAWDDREVMEEVMACMLLSEDALKKDWDTPEEDKAWEHL